MGKKRRAKISHDLSESNASFVILDTSAILAFCQAELKRQSQSERAAGNTETVFTALQQLIDKGIDIVIPHAVIKELFYTASGCIGLNNGDVGQFVHALNQNIADLKYEKSSVFAKYLIEQTNAHHVDVCKTPQAFETLRSNRKNAGKTTGRFIVLETNPIQHPISGSGHYEASFALHWADHQIVDFVKRLNAAEPNGICFPVITNDIGIINTLKDPKLFDKQYGQKARPFGINVKTLIDVELGLGSAQHTQLMRLLPDRSMTPNLQKLQRRETCQWLKPLTQGAQPESPKSISPASRI